MKETYSTYNGLSHDETIDEMVTKYAARKNISDVEAAKVLLGGEMLDNWLSQHDKKLAIA